MKDNKFGSFIRTERLRMGLTCKEFAKKIGISSVQLSNIETGKCLPRINTLDKYATGLNVDKTILNDMWIEDYGVK